MQVLVARGRRTSLLLVQEITRRILSHKDFRDGTTVVRAKARPGLPVIRTADMFPLPSARTCEAGLPSYARIPGFRDNAVPIISGTGVDTVRSFSPQCGSGGLVPVLGCCTSAFFYTDRRKRPGNGLRSSIELTGRDFRDPGACLRHHTTD